MKNGYDQFFKSARQAAKPEGTKLKMDLSKGIKLNISNEELLERELRNRAGVKARKRKKKPFPWKLAGMSFLGLVLAFYGLQNYEHVEHLVKNIEISLLGAAQAEEAPVKKAAPAKAEAKADPKAAVADVKTADGEVKRDPAADADPEHLQKLIDRKKELDAREEELNRVEQELVAQKQELEKRMKELEDMRAQISSMLENRVKVDDQKIDTLVQMYSNMKAPQAAKVFETMDEDLAVEIIGRMKKKNAADIMNLLKPEKAQLFSEKFAGYKRK